jgi:hypothetical protein
VLVDFKGTVLPVFHIVMTSKHQGLYSEILEKLKEFGGDLFTPQQGMSDFEKGLMNALSGAFPGMKVTGCRFHFGQAVLRKIKETMAVDFRDDKVTISGTNQKYFYLILKT